MQTVWSFLQFKALRSVQMGPEPHLKEIKDQHKTSWNDCETYTFAHVDEVCLNWNLNRSQRYTTNFNMVTTGNHNRSYEYKLLGFDRTNNCCVPYWSCYALPEQDVSRFQAHWGLRLLCPNQLDSSASDTQRRAPHTTSRLHFNALVMHWKLKRIWKPTVI